METLDLISYGKNKFIKSKWTGIKNKGWNKPNGGLWSSPENSKYGWKNFVKDQLFKPMEYNRCFIKFRLKDNSRIYIIDSMKDLENIPYKIERNVLGYPDDLIDFEKMSQDYDALWLTYNGEYSTRYGGIIPGNYGSSRMGLYGWDVETVLILNKNSIVFPEVKIIINKGYKKNGKIYTTKKEFKSFKALYRFYKNKSYSIGSQGLYEPIFKGSHKIGFISIRYKNSLPSDSDYLVQLDSDFSEYIDKHFLELV